MRIDPNEFLKQSENNNNNSQTEWLSLKNDGDVARVQFLYHTFDDLDCFNAHRVAIGDTERYVNCKRDYDSPLEDCPFCASGISSKKFIVLAMYDLNDGKIKTWERGTAFAKKINALCNRYQDLSKMVFEIERRGARGDKNTTYEIYPMPEIMPKDISNIQKPEFLGKFILDKSADDMQYYLDNGDFRREDNHSTDEPIMRRNSRRG